MTDLTGMRFGRLTVTARAENYIRFTMDPFGGRNNMTTQPRWRCRCDCGEETIVFGHNLLSGRTRSCGCYRREVASRKRKSKATASLIASLTQA